jgi:hypothetical protein
MKPDNPYRACMEELAKGGEHRNVFLVDGDEQPVWRIADYKPSLPDYVSVIRRGTVSTQATAVTFDGWLLDIDLADGSTQKSGKTK